MAKQVSVPIRVVNKVEWGNLAALGMTHDLVAESVKVNEKYSFAGNHRVRLITLKKSVLWKISGAAFDISDVPLAAPARRLPRR